MDLLRKTSERLFSVFVRGPMWAALAIGLASSWTFEITSMGLRHLDGHSLPDERGRFLGVVFPHLVAWAASLGLAVVLGRALGVKRGMREYVTVNGYAGLIGIVSMAPLIGMMLARKLASDVPTLGSLVALVMNWLLIGSITYVLYFWGYTVRRALGFGRFKAIVFVLIVSLPTVWVAQSFGKLNAGEKKSAGWVGDTTKTSTRPGQP